MENSDEDLSCLNTLYFVGQHHLKITVIRLTFSDSNYLNLFSSLHRSLLVHLNLPVSDNHCPSPKFILFYGWINNLNVHFKAPLDPLIIKSNREVTVIIIVLKFLNAIIEAADCALTKVGRY